MGVVHEKQGTVAIPVRMRLARARCVLRGFQRRAKRVSRRGMRTRGPEAAAAGHGSGSGWPREQQRLARSTCRQRRARRDRPLRGEIGR